MSNKGNNKTITLMQALLLYISAVYAPNIRFLTKTAVSHAHQAAWLVYLCSMVVFIPLLYVLFKMTRTWEGHSYHDIMCRVFGKGLGKSIAVVYIVWMFILLSLYIKYTGEQLVTSAYVGTDIRLIMFLIVLIIGFMLRKGLQVLSRMNIVVLVLGILQLLIIFAFLIPKIQIGNVTPISRLDTMPVLQSIIYPMTISVYITFFFIFNDQIKYGKKNGGQFAFTVIYLCIVNTLVLLIVLGVFGYELAGKLTFPFLTAAENITIFDATAGMDSLLLAIWMLQEFVTESLFAYCICRLLRSIFVLKSETPVLTAILGFAFFFAVYLCSDVFELILFSENVVVIGNLALGFGVPILLFGVAKARKLL